ncbi:hypothetical protein M0802_011269 [Mischocyttarus mexicanus]|nr:hypothetical protein M0802_011269 [Mischocyttarus mexicanus]
MTGITKPSNSHPIHLIAIFLKHGADQLDKLRLISPKHYHQLLASAFSYVLLLIFISLLRCHLGQKLCNNDLNFSIQYTPLANFHIVLPKYG